MWAERLSVCRSELREEIEERAPINPSPRYDGGKAMTAKRGPVASGGANQQKEINGVEVWKLVK